MYKTLIQLVLLLILVLIFYFIYNKYFYTEDIVDELKNPPSINKEIAETNDLSNKNLINENTDNEIIDLTMKNLIRMGISILSMQKRNNRQQKSKHYLYE